MTPANMHQSCSINTLSFGSFLHFCAGLIITKGLWRSSCSESDVFIRMQAHLSASLYSPQPTPDG